MKNTQDKKFGRQVNHLQSFIGMPHWNGRNPTLQEIREYDRRLIEKQAMGFKAKRKSVLQRLFGWVRVGASTASNEVVSANSTLGIKTGKKISGKTRKIKEPVDTGSVCCQ